jgi:uncharacterized protein YutE (UPF0331/DUF86 family)
LADDAQIALVERKLALIVEYTDELEEVLGSDPDGFRGNVQRRAVERLVQLVVEVTTDVNGVIAAMNRLPSPSTSRRSFEAAQQAGVIDENIAQRFKATYVGLRNRIVHDYDRIDDAIVARSAAHLVRDAREYGRQVRDHLQTLRS